MSRRSGGLFAGRGIALPGVGATLLVIALAFALGIGAGWLTGYVPELYRSWQAGPEPSASPSPSATAEPEGSLDPLAPITRELDEADAFAGIVTALIPERGEGTFTAAPGATPTVEGGGPVRYVRVDIEDGLTVDVEALVGFVMGTLNDSRGWGSTGRLQFVQTDGAADLRVVFASPYTASTMCSNPHAAATVDLPDAEPSPSPSASSSSFSSASTSSATPIPCAVQGIAPISIYDWTAGVAPYGDRRTDARRYLLAHFAGHVLAEEDVPCDSGRASVMTVQADMPDACTANPWPFPDAGGA